MKRKSMTQFAAVAAILTVGMLGMSTGTANAYTCPRDKFAHVNVAVRLAVHSHWSSHHRDKCVSLHHHQFWVKPVKVMRQSNGSYKVGLWGSSKDAQLSHILSLRPDDQYYYSFTISPSGKITEFHDSIDRGGFSRLLVDVGAQKILANLSGGRLSDSDIKILIEKWGNKIGRKLEGTWEGTAKTIALKVAAVVAGDVARNHQRTHPVAKMQSHTGTIVRDHRTR